VGREYLLPIVDDRVLGGLLPRTYLRLDVEPGRHRLFASYSGVDRSPPLDVDLAAGDLLFARIRRSHSPVEPRTAIERLDDAPGRRAVRRFRRGLAFHGTPLPPQPAEPQQADPCAPEAGRSLVYVVRQGTTDSRPSDLEPGYAPPPESKLALILDGRLVALMGKRTYTGFSVEPGHHALVGTVIPIHELEPRELEAEAGACYFFEASTSTRGRSRKSRIEALGEADARDLLRSNRLLWLE
jgi:hypothetical protein